MQEYTLHLCPPELSRRISSLFSVRGRFAAVTDALCRGILKNSSALSSSTDARAKMYDFGTGGDAEEQTVLDSHLYEDIFLSDFENTQRGVLSPGFTSLLTRGALLSISHVS
jgi:hypothetical protein